jgi:ADP-ribose pyrophosphatase
VTLRIIDSRTLTDVGFTRLDELTVEAPDGTHATRYALRLPSAVAVVPIREGEVTLIEQYRAPHNQVILEIPAGMLDVAGEGAEETARRELEEEVGLTASSLTHLVDIATSPGVTDEIVSVYLAEGVEPATRRPHGIEERYATVVVMPLDEALGMVSTGRIADAKTVVGLLLASAVR